MRLTVPRNTSIPVIRRLLTEGRGGFNRARIITVLRVGPMNLSQLCAQLELDYRTVRQHLEVLENSELIRTEGSGNSTIFYLTESLENILKKS